MFEKKTVFVITGLYGVGKAKLAKNAGWKLNMTVGRAYATCRCWAEGERDYSFVSPKELDNLGETLSYRDVFGNNCAISIDELEASDIFIADPAAAECIKNCYTGNSRIKIVAINAPVDQRRERLLYRGLSNAAINEIFRAEAGKAELLSKIADAEFVNDKPNKKGVNSFEEYILITCLSSDEEVKKLAYGVYASEWLLEHGITIPKVIETVSEWVAKAYGGHSSAEIRDILWRGLMRKSFGGEHFAGFEEFLAGPYKDEYYRDKLLSRMEKRYHMINFKQMRKEEIRSGGV